MFVIEPETEEDFRRYYDLRWRMLRKPWNQPRESEKDGLDEKGIHIMVCENDRIPVGVGRAHFNSPKGAQIRYMAVEPEYRGKGIGKLMVKELEAGAEKKGAKRIMLNAREGAVKFYEKNGYRMVAKAHILFGSIPHYKMEKNL